MLKFLKTLLYKKSEKVKSSEKHKRKFLNSKIKSFYKTTFLQKTVHINQQKI